VLLEGSPPTNHDLLFVINLPPVEVGVEARALICSVTLLLLARLRFVVQRVVLKLFPAMALQAAPLEVASLFIRADEGS
jgi:hypothetical protein